MCTEICAGNLLDVVSGKYKGPEIGDCLSSLKQITRGLNHLHLLNIVHGDLEPNNILISLPKGDLKPKWKISGFGLRHTVQRKKFGSETEENQFLPAFTEGWMCPSDPVDEDGERSSSFDIFALGLTFGFLAQNGVHPFGSRIEEAIDRIKYKWPMTLTLAKVNENVRTTAFMNLLVKMLNFDASKRPTAAQILSSQIFKKQRPQENLETHSSASRAFLPTVEAPVVDDRSQNGLSDKETALSQGTAPPRSIQLGSR